MLGLGSYVTLYVRSTGIKRGGGGGGGGGGEWGQSGWKTWMPCRVTGGWGVEWVENLDAMQGERWVWWGWGWKT